MNKRNLGCLILILLLNIVLSACGVSGKTVETDTQEVKTNRNFIQNFLSLSDIEDSENPLNVRMMEASAMAVWEPYKDADYYRVDVTMDFGWFSKEERSIESIDTCADLSQMIEEVLEEEKKDASDLKKMQMKVNVFSTRKDTQEAVESSASSFPVYLLSKGEGSPVYLNEKPSKKSASHVHFPTEPLLENKSSKLCTEEGFSDYVVYCLDCRKELSREEVFLAAREHKLITEEMPPSCTKKGELITGCSECNYIEKEKLAALGHDYTRILQAAEPGADGYIKDVCTRCDQSIELESIAAPEDVVLSEGNFTYDGKIHKPKLTVYDSEGRKISKKYYELVYADDLTNAGRKKICVNFSGNYSGSLLAKYTIKKASQNLTVPEKITKNTSNKRFSCGAKLLKGDGELSYASSNLNIASVDSKGKITVKGAGKAKITVTAAANDNYKEAKKSFYVIVKPVKVRNVSLSADTADGKLSVYFDPVEDADGYHIQYSRYKDFSNSKTRKISGNQTYAKLTKLYEGERYYVRIRSYKTVKGTNYCSKWSSWKSERTLHVRLSRQAITLTEGETYRLFVKGTDQSASWTSSNSSVASIHWLSNGTIEAEKTGTTTITATVAGVSRTCSVTVKAKPQTASVRSSGGGNVMVTRTGECYHTHKCGNGYYYWDSLADAKARGLRPCKKCY